jgi:hypothetical protein
MTTTSEGLDGLEQDSPDLLDDEIESATVTNKYGELRDALIHLSCGSCGVRLQPAKHTLRRRKPNLFWRILLTCNAGHTMTKTYRTNWLEPDDGKQ